MFDTDTFLTVLYVAADDFCKSQLPQKKRPGREASLSQSEVITLAVFGQWEQFPSERAFYRYADHHLRAAFPTLPYRGQLNRLVRQHQAAIEAFFLYLVERLEARQTPFETLDGSAARTRNCKRRGAGWLAGLADIGWSNRLGWYEGLRVLVATTRVGMVTGFGIAPASTNDRAIAETFLALRHEPDGRLPTVGRAATGIYVADKGFEGRQWFEHWQDDYQAAVIVSPNRSSRQYWPKPWRRLLASIRQIVETVYEKIHYAFRLDRERPHELTGFQARLAAKMALHNFCIWLNKQSQRPLLAFADLIDW